MSVAVGEDSSLINQAAIQGSNRSFNNADEDVKPTPLPVSQLFVLCVMRITEPISFTVIFPFINQMIEDLHIASDRSQVGSYAGVIESLFAFSQLCTVLFWGRLSDRLGRRPVLLSGLMGLTVGMIAFGLQRSLLGLILARAVAGGMNGNIVVVKSVIAEVTDETNQAMAFPLLPLAYAIGLAVGPAIGGYTAKPAVQYPHLKFFTNHSFFTDYPYFLPCFIAGLTNWIAFMLGFYFLDETLPSKRKIEHSRRRSCSLLTSVDDLYPDPVTIPASYNQVEEVPSLKSLMTKDILLVMLSFTCLSIENAIWPAIIPLFSYTRVKDGGLGLSMNQIGSILSGGGFIAVIVQTCCFPAMQKKLGTLRLYKCVALGFPLTFISLPIIGVLANQVNQDSRFQVLKCGLIISLFFKAVGNMAIVCVNLLLNSVTPSQAALGTINGMAQLCSSMSRTIGPGVTGYLFSESIRRKSGLVWWVLIVGAILGYLTTWVVREGKPDWRKPKTAAKPAERVNGGYGTV